VRPHVKVAYTSEFTVVRHFLQQRHKSVVPSAVVGALFILFDLFDGHNVLLTAVKQLITGSLFLLLNGLLFWFL
jgi:hypothetical protein